MSERHDEIKSIGWTGRLMRWESLAIFVILAILIAIGIVYDLRHGPNPRGGIDATGGPVATSKEVPPR